MCNIWEHVPNCLTTPPPLTPPAANQGGNFHNQGGLLCLFGFKIKHIFTNRVSGVGCRGGQTIWDMFPNFAHLFFFVMFPNYSFEMAFPPNSGQPRATQFGIRKKCAKFGNMSQIFGPPLTPLWEQKNAASGHIHRFAFINISHILLTCILAHLHTFILAYSLPCILAYLHIFILAYLHTCILVYPCILAYLYTCILAYLHTYILAYLNTS